MGKCNVIGAGTSAGGNIVVGGTGLKYAKARCGLFASGSYTLEAAFVFPVVLGICFAILYSIFFYHDKAVMQSNLEEMLLLEAEGRPLNEEQRGEYLQRQLWFFTCRENQITKGALYIKGSVGATATLRIPLLTFFLEENQTISLSEKYPLIHPASYRRYRKNGKEKSNGEADAG